MSIKSKTIHVIEMQSLEKDEILNLFICSTEKGHWVKHGMEWIGMEWNGLEWNGMEWNGMDWIGMEWNGILSGTFSFHLKHPPLNPTAP